MCFIKKNSVIRVLETDNAIVLTRGANYNCFISSNDVLHSWSLPRLHIKIDAIPGRLNSFNIYNNFPKELFGQCSELCGVNHRFIPINLIFI